MIGVAQRAQTVVQTVVRPLSLDGTTAELRSIDDGIAYVTYVRGTEGECDTCFMSGPEFEEFLSEAFRSAVPEIRGVVVEEPAH